jgi:hypothetical protein
VDVAEGAAGQSVALDVVDAALLHLHYPCWSTPTPEEVTSGGTEESGDRIPSRSSTTLRATAPPAG